MMQKLTLLFCCVLLALTTNAQVYEDFEGGAKLPWAGLNGQTYETIDNPDKNGANTSAKVGKLTNNNTSDFNFALSDLPAAADLSKKNLLKMKVWAPFTCQVLLKFEGGGKAVEKFVDIPEANKWLDLTFDLSGGANFTTLTKILIAFNPFKTPQEAVFYFDDIRGVESATFYETFESGNEMGWLGLDGVLEAPIANPAPNQINSSANVGKYTKSDKHAYSLLLADRGTNTLDLSVDNQFKLQVHASAPTQILLKLEGPGGPAIEKIANIGLTDQWQEYTFDFSAAKDYKHLTKVIIFFDPGVETSADVYHFDNLTAVPKGSCEGVAAIPTMVDDFECNRNATYVNGWESLVLSNNPAPNAVNNSAKVGKYFDPQGEEWAALLVDYQNPIDLSKYNQLSLKIWSPKPSKFLAKLEAGSPAKEVAVTISEANTWVEYVVDFSSEALSSFKKIVLFMNHGTLPEPNDVYYIDEIQWKEKTATDLENFENGAFLPWEPLEGNTAIHGTFAVVDNPAPAAPNASSKVGKYTKGSSPFSTVSAVAPSIIDISKKPQYNLDVWAPAGSKDVTFQLESVSKGNKSVTREIKNAGNWETLSFDFSNDKEITDWASMRIIFNPSKAEQGQEFYFDNLNQSETTVDPCEKTVEIASIISDFECQQNYEFGAGKDFLSIVNNPKNSPVNSSVKVGLYKDQANEPWAALCANMPEGINLDAFNQLSIQVLSPSVDIPVLLKLEGGDSPASEVWTKTTKGNEWETLSVDFSGQKGKSHKRACVFLNGGVASPDVINFHIDNFQFAHAPFDGCIMNFDDPAFVSDAWRYFPADNSGAFELVDNPKKEGINTSAKVGKAIEKASGEQPWQGMYTDLPSYIKFGSNKKLKMKVLSPQVGKITMKLERPLKEGAPQSGDLNKQNTKANEWEEITFDFAETPAVDDGLYARITLIWDIENVPAQDVVYYFDDVKLEGGNCGDLVGVNEQEIGSLSVYPNPVQNTLYIKDAASIKTTSIVDVYGRRLASISHNGSDVQAIDVSRVPQGSYLVQSHDAQGRLTAVTRIVKI